MSEAVPEDGQHDDPRIVVPEEFIVRTGMTLDKVERMLVEATLRACKFNKSVTARVLGIDRKTLHRKLSLWGIN